MSAKSTDSIPTPKPTYACGTLRYTGRGLIVLFAWLLWGDFCFTLMEAVVPSVLPLKLRSLDSSNLLIGFIMTTLPGMFNVTVTPWLSFKSDRHRGRWGRRLPFIIGTMPFLCLTLVLIGFSDSIGAWVSGHWLGGSGVSQARVIIVLLAVFAGAFDFFNMFVCTVYWYMFNDIVPQAWMGRFMAWFRIVGTLASALYNFFIFRFAESHMREIFLAAALIYLVGFGVMCLRIREGQYPPPPEKEERLGFLTKLRIYGRECFTMRYYWDIFLTYTFQAMSGAVGVYAVFVNKSLGLNLDRIGKMGALSSITLPVCLLFVGVLVDRWHPVRVCAYTAAYLAFFALGGWVWLLIDQPDPSLYFWLGTIQAAFFGVWFTGLQQVADSTRLMQLLPQEKYGQFCGAMAFIRAIAVTVGGVAAGVFMDGWMHFFPTTQYGNYGYRFGFLWSGGLVILGFYFHYRTYRAWKRLGGLASYTPPAAAFRLSSLTPRAGDDGAVHKGIVWFTAIAFGGGILGGLAWIAYYVFVRPNLHYAIVFAVALSVNVTLYLAYLRFVRFMERP